MDKNTKRHNNKTSYNQDTKLKPKQLIKHKDLSKSSRLPHANDKPQNYFQLQKQFQDFKESFQETMMRRQPSINNFLKCGSMSTSNLLNYKSSDNLKRNSKNSIQNNESFQYKLRNILEKSSQKSENELQQAPKEFLLLKEQMLQMFISQTSPIFKQLVRLSNKLVRVEEMSSRLKYIYRRKNPKHSIISIIDEIESPKNQNIKRRNTEKTESCSQLSSLTSSNKHQDKKILEISLKNILQHEKISFDTIHKKNRLIDLLVEQIQQIQMKRQLDLDMLREQMKQKQMQYEDKIKQISKQLTDTKSLNKDKEYEVEELKANLKRANLKNSQLQQQLSSANMIRQIKIRQSADLQRVVKRLQQQVKIKSDELQKSRVISFENINLNQKLLKSTKDIEFYKRYSEEQYKNIEKEFRDIDDGYSKMKASNYILTNKLAQSQKECSYLRKQLNHYCKESEKIYDIEGYNLLGKNKIDIDVEQLERKVEVLERLLEESQLRRMKLGQQPRSSPPKHQKYSQQVYGSLKQFIKKLEGEIVEKDRKIWLLENNIARIKSNKPELPILFSPKSSNACTPEIKINKRSSGESTNHPHQPSSNSPLMIESVAIEQFSLANYI